MKIKESIKEIIMKTPIGSGIITNYNCTASCRHCMFASSPECKKEFINAETAEKVAALLEESGCDSVHIGGGEPFMNFEALCTLIEALNRHRIDVDYIENNAFWCYDKDFVRRRLERLKELCVSCVMASVDPFHIEFVPLVRPLLLCETLEEMGFDYFIWQQKFLNRLSVLDMTKTHTMEELKDALGEDYITETAAEYGLGMNGRALAIAEELYQRKSAESLATSDKCPTLTQPHHCHIDLYGNAIPSRCTGLAVDARDYLEGNFPEEKYPVYSRLVKGGTKELYEYAKEKGFVPDKDGYPTRCYFCYKMREYLFKNCPSPDLAPESFYNEIEKTLK